MAKKTVKNAINFMRYCLEQQGVCVDKIVLFGSHAHGTATKESDIDLVIISRDFEGKNIFERVKLTTEAEVSTIKKFMIPFDIVTLTPDEYENETSLIASYAKEGKVIYAQ